MRFQLLLPFCIILMFTSCIVQSPQYARIDNVLALEVGMTKAEVEEVLGVGPYDLKAYSDSSRTLIYVYRVDDRRTLSLLTNEHNGKATLGKYVQLNVTYSNVGKMVAIETCSMCPDNMVGVTKIDFEKLLGFMMVTVPALLILVGVQF
jgi:outer membrane protein assembly factor BamE (lipoprotein component of BamABCDE complex)